jgi:hypothetical protein
MAIFSVSVLVFNPASWNLPLPPAGGRFQTIQLRQPFEAEIASDLSRSPFDLAA